MAVYPRHGRQRYDLDPLHYLRLLERKPGLLDQARPFHDDPFGPEFSLFRRELEYRYEEGGTRQYIDVLLLLTEHPEQKVVEAVRRCVEWRVFATPCCTNCTVSRGRRSRIAWTWPIGRIWPIGATVSAPATSTTSSRRGGEGMKKKGNSLLLESYLKTLRLPTMLGEYPGVARQCADKEAAYDSFHLASLFIVDLQHSGSGDGPQKNNLRTNPHRCSVFDPQGVIPESEWLAKRLTRHFKLLLEHGLAVRAF